MAGYTRQDTNDNIATGKVINASDFDNEYNAIQTAFNASTGHKHDGTAAEGARITVIGPAGKFNTDANAFFPTNTGTVGLGKQNFVFKDLHIDNIVADGNTISTITSGNLIVDPYTYKLEVKGGTTGGSTSGMIQLNCENNSHGQTIQAQPHSAGVTNKMLLPAGADSTLVSLVSADTLENKTLTTATLTTPIFSGISTTGSGNLQVKPATSILEVQGDGSSVEGQIKLNCHVNSHGQTIKAQPHSESVTNTMLLPKGANSTLVSLVSTDTLTNKTIDLTDNTISGTTAEFNTALSDGSFATLAGSEALTNKTFNADNSASGNTLSNVAFSHLAGSTYVTESEGIGSNDNDTTLPTSAAVKDYVDTQVAGVPTGDITEVTAGTGLTGGGASGAVTLNVIGGTGITANANDIAIDSTVATLTGTQTLTNKTLTSPKINENVALSATATELNRLDGALFGGAASGKAVILDNGGNFINDLGSFKTQGFIDQGDYNSLSAGTHTLDWTDHGYLVILLTGNVTLVMGLPALVGGTGNESGVSAAAYCTLKVVQDGSGSHSIQWPSSTVLKWAGGTAPTLTGTPNSCDVFTFFCHDTAANGSLGSWYGFTAGLNVS
tara:strand:+ start:11170 stop:13002 length:1833 start_codon:yes stop_codon:yes gene_type:complete